MYVPANLTFFGFFKTGIVRTPLYPTWFDYEDNKRDLQKQRMSPEVYADRIKALASELNL